MHSNKAFSPKQIRIEWEPNQNISTTKKNDWGHFFVSFRPAVFISPTRDHARRKLLRFSFGMTVCYGAKQSARDPIPRRRSSVRNRCKLRPGCDWMEERSVAYTSLFRAGDDRHARAGVSSTGRVPCYPSLRRCRQSLGKQALLVGS